jgi:hypothetical protein
MRRKTFDLISSSVRVLLAVLLLVAAGLHMRRTPAEAELQPVRV